MPFYDENEDENEDLVANGGAPTTGAGSSTIGTSGGSGSTDVNAPKAAVAAPSTFAGIKDYVNANKNQTAGLANDVGGLVNNYGNEARTKINEGVNQFNQAVDQNTVNLDDRVFNTAKTKAQDVTAVQPDLDTFIGMRDAEYKGPTSLETSEFYKPVNDAYTQAQTAINNTQSDAGQKQLLGELQQSQRGKVNQGSLALNSALLQGDTNARSILDNVKSANSDIEGLFNSSKASAASKATAGKTTTDNTKLETNNALNSTFQALKDSLEGKVTQAQNKYVSTEDVATGKQLTDAQLVSMGISRDLYNAVVADPIAKNLLNQQLKAANKVSIGEVNRNTVASAEDYAREQALLDLMGPNGAANDFIRSPELAGTGVLNNAINVGQLKQQAIQEAERRVTEARDAAKAQYALSLSRISQGQQAPDNYWIQYWAENNIDEFLKNPARMSYYGISPQYADSVNKYTNAANQYRNWK